jgi:uncharacterized membrane protein YozB (DUF420 family)
MDAIRRSRNALAILVLFVVVGVAYMAFADPFGYHIEWAGVTMLVTLGAAMGLMVYVLVNGTPQD